MTTINKIHQILSLLNKQASNDFFYMGENVFFMRKLTQEERNTIANKQIECYSYIDYMYLYLNAGMCSTYRFHEPHIINEKLIIILTSILERLVKVDIEKEFLKNYANRFDRQARCKVLSMLEQS